MLIGAVKLRAIDESAAIIANHFISEGGLGAGPRRDDFVLQATGQGNHSFFGFVGGQERFALLLIGDGGLLSLFFLLGPHLSLPLHQRVARLVFSHQCFAVAQTIFNRLGKDIWVNLNSLQP